MTTEINLLLSSCAKREGRRRGSSQHTYTHIDNIWYLFFFLFFTCSTFNLSTAEICFLLFLLSLNVKIFFSSSLLNLIFALCIYVFLNLIKHVTVPCLGPKTAHKKQRKERGKNIYFILFFFSIKMHIHLPSLLSQSLMRFSSQERIFLEKFSSSSLSWKFSFTSSIFG